MEQGFLVNRTSTDDSDFQSLITSLDHELWNELKEDQATYDQFNKVAHIATAIIVYTEDKPVACGCFKAYENDAVEIKRMFVQKAYRGRGLSKLVLHELETWAIENGYRYAVLETSIHFKTARNLYTSSGYKIIPNYPPYAGLDESVCMKKALKK